MIFIDSNVPMYMVGAPHLNKDRVLATLAQLVRDGERFVTDVEVYQEILRKRKINPTLPPTAKSLHAVCSCP